MSTAPTARRPRFLADVPDVPAPEPVRFAAAGARGAGMPRPQRAQAERPASAPTGPSFLGSGPDPEAFADLRREAMSRVAAAVETLRAQADRLCEAARADAIEVGFLVARRILEAELHQGPEALFELVRSAVRKAASSRRVSVHLHPEDAALVGSELTRDREAGGEPQVEVVSDAELERGDCLVDTEFGQVDGRLATRLGELRRSVDAAAGGAT